MAVEARAQWCGLMASAVECATVLDVTCGTVSDAKRETSTWQRWTVSAVER
jgi:hypothetical protein